MMAALVAYVSRRWFRRLAVVLVVAVAFVWSVNALGIGVAAPVWALLLVPAIVHASSHDTGDAFPCGHRARVVGCGGCDAGAIEFVTYPDGRTVRCVWPGTGDEADQ